MTERIPHEMLHDAETVLRCCAAVAASLVASAVAAVGLAAILLRPRPHTRPLDDPHSAR